MTPDGTGRSALPLRWSQVYTSRTLHGSGIPGTLYLMPPKLPATSSFRRALFLAVFLVALVPVALTLGGGALLVRQIGATTGTAGPWDSVAESGRTLIEAARAAAPADSSVARAAAAHGDVLSESVRRSRSYAFIVERSARLLPVAALSLGVVLALLAAWAAGRLSTRLSAPIQELVNWTRHIARGEPLPDPAGARNRSVSIAEFATLGDALREMDSEIRASRAREVEDARLRAWSEMARRVAHDLKNPLTPIRVSAGTLARSDDPATRDAAEIILEEVERLDERARAFARYGRPPEGPAADVDLTELLAKLIDRHSREDGIALAGDLPEQLPHVLGHHHALERALLNLIVNAHEALEGRTDGVVHIRAHSSNGLVMVDVEDNGDGIADEHRDRIWEADFTTRRRGTGLGLAIVRQTVEAHGGSVDAEARDGGGTRFRVSLPVARGATA